MIKKLVFSLLFILALSAHSQDIEINNYKYIIVQEKFDFLKEQDQYQTSSLTKFLLQKKGFTVFLSNEQFPAELSENRCLALIADVIDDSSMFTVKNKIELKDCYDKVLYVSEYGKSKEKDYKKGHHEAIRAAYATMSNLVHHYKPNNKVTIKKETVNPEVVLPTKQAVVKENVVLEKVIVKTQIISESNVEVLYAQAKTNGFQLVNTTPAIVFQILKTNVNDVFIIKGKNGIIYSNKNTWIAEYYDNDQLVVKQFDIKF
tara:strand:- start:579 stop:1358 length:780 start_codon:yes stop_codon:yes gene_type:complete